MEIVEVAKQFTPQALVEAKRILEISSCQESSRIAFTVKSYSVEKKSSTFNIHIYDSCDCSVLQLTRGNVSTSPQFLTNMGAGVCDQICMLRDGQVWSLPGNGGEAKQVTSFPLGIEHYRVFKNECDQLWLIAVMEVFADKTPEETVELDKTKGSSGVEYHSLMVRHW